MSFRLSKIDHSLPDSLKDDAPQPGSSTPESRIKSSLKQHSPDDLEGRLWQIGRGRSLLSGYKAVCKESDYARSLIMAEMASQGYQAVYEAF